MITKVKTMTIYLTSNLYSDYKDKITPLQASDPFLWSALCHISFKEYVLKRWKKDDGTVRLNQRFFATESRDSLLYYNAISRLWWSGYLTYDETRTYRAAHPARRRARQS